MAAISCCLESTMRQGIQLLGDQGLSQWRSRHGGPAPWKIGDGYIEVIPGTGDIVTLQEFGDFQLHLEFCIPPMPEATGQNKGNSGLYLQGLYEIQILDSYQNETYPMRACGALYNQAAPLANASLPPGQWQTYDIEFVAPQPERPGTLMVYQNGILIHDNVKVEKPTGGGLELPQGSTGPILLQDHRCPVRFRNLFVIA